MSAQSVDDLARRFSMPGIRWDDGGVPFMTVATDRCRARLTPHGAHVCEWTPAGQATSALFLSPHAVFATGKAIRGGVPICFPWFGNHATDPGKPAHGFARTRPWEIARVDHDGDGNVIVAMRLAADNDTRRDWDAEFTASLTVSLGTTLAMTLDVENRGAREIEYEAALHTYLTVGDVERIAIHGLEPNRYVDKADGVRTKAADGAPITIRGDVDRIYLNTRTTCVVHDPLVQRRIRVEKSGSEATVIWNPGAAKGQLVPDIREAWQNFVCVETANCGPHRIRLAPNSHHETTATISVERIRV